MQTEYKSELDKQIFSLFDAIESRNVGEFVVEKSIKMAQKAMDTCPVGSIIRKEKGFDEAIGTRKFDKVPIGHEIENKEICRIIVMSAHRPVFVKDGANPKLYLRTGVSTRELNIQEAVEYIPLHWPSNKKNILNFW